MTSDPAHLTGLNPEQYEAVTTTTGPLLILAGAGSGKTRVLTRRIAHLLHTGVSPERILAVTFTNKAAAEMKERVVELVGEGGRKVWISTFHSTCCRILRQDIEALGYTRRFAIYDDDDQRRVIKDIMDALNMDRKREDPRALSGQIDHYKNRMLGVDDIVSQKRHSPTSTLVRIWREYDAMLQTADALDFNDLIGMTVRLYREHPGIRSKWQERFQYLLVDEYQDTNRGQYDLLHQLVGDDENIAVVGDDDQSIYGFRGADVSIIRSFHEDHPSAKIVRLEQNYRSSKNILDVANALVAKNSERLDKSLWTEAPDGPQVQMLLCGNPMDEARSVSRMIHQLRRMGRSYQDIAVIYRTNAMSRPLEQAFVRDNIPHRIVGGRKFYERREIRDMLCYLRLVVNPADDAAFLRVVNVPRRGVGAASLRKLRDEATERGTPLLATARSGAVARKNAGLRAFTQIIDELGSLALEREPGELITELVVRSGYRTMLEGDRTSQDQITVDARNRLANLEELIKDAAQFQPPELMVTPVEILTAWLDRIALSADSDDIPDGGEVTMMTVHSSKGLEYPIIIVVQMNEGKFPHSRSLDSGIDEERRLAYVAFTRAMERLVVTRTRSDTQFSGGRLTESAATSSRFLFDLPEAAIAGDLPSGVPASVEAVSLGMPDEKRQKLKTFLGNRRQGPPGDYTLVDLESLEEVESGVRLHFAGVGVCEVLSRRGSSVTVKLPTGRTKRVVLGQIEAQRVVED